MDEKTPNSTPEPARRRRKPRSKMQIFKESYLPLLIAGLTVIMILVFIIGSVSRAVSRHKAETAASIAASQSVANEAKRLNEEVKSLIEEAEYLASGYDYEGAIAVLDTFSGKAEDFPALQKQRILYQEELSKLVVYEDPAQIPNLSFQMLIADPVRAYQDDDYADAYRRNFITVSEFEKLLQQLYDNDYMLVGLRDLVTVSEDPETGKPVYTPKKLYLPIGKKPVMLTETSVNYYSYMIDSDNDGNADQGGAGFASNLTFDADGMLTNTYVDAQGTTQYGAYDLVPILDRFIAAHPDFSFRGARAILAVSGYDGLFGYRTQPSAKETLGEEVYARNVSDATAVAEALRLSGYEIACYTYENMSYESSGAAEIQTDLGYWKQEVTPILGNVDILVFAQNCDIGDRSPYSGDKYQVLYNAGFRYFIGTDSGNMPWASAQPDYFRQHRITVTGSGLENTGGMYGEYFDAASILDPARTSGE